MSQSPSTSYQVLIVEDTQEFAELARIILTRAGMNTYHAATGEAAIAYLQAERPDLILLDLYLEDNITGWNVLECATEKYGQNSIPVVVTTAHNDPANRLVGKLQDIAGYLVKPFTGRELLDAIDAARNHATNHS
jgi:DNA-binding response OmpR family regulator